jgi:hypothetical protein
VKTNRDWLYTNIAKNTASLPALGISWVLLWLNFEDGSSNFSGRYAKLRIELNHFQFSMSGVLSSAGLG